MRILLLTQHYYPEDLWQLIQEAAAGLVARGHTVTVLTAFPHYGKGRVYEGYRGKIFEREVVEGIPVIRSWVFANPSKKTLPRILNFASFALSSLVAGLLFSPDVDVIYAYSPPLPVALTGALLARSKRCYYALNIQDIYPRVAIEHGALTNKRAIRFFEGMERWIYRQADRIIVIAQAFFEDLISRGVPPEKVRVVTNWADPGFVQARETDNPFRRSLAAEGKFVVIYSGGINNNANVEPLIRSAAILRDEPFLFVIVGEGQYKQNMEALAVSLGVTNVRFFPFQPVADYLNVLCAADMNVVSLNSRSAMSSVPSKVYKQMAAGRSILAITPKVNELFRLVNTANCGICVPPDDPDALVEAVRWARVNPAQLTEQGHRARAYLIEHHGVEKCVDLLSASLVSCFR